jgi:hypothetical protein
MPPDSSPPPGSPAGPVLRDGSVLELYDVTQPGRLVVLSEWNDPASHDAMVRAMGLLWSDYRDRRY